MTTQLKPISKLYVPFVVENNSHYTSYKSVELLVNKNKYTGAWQYRVFVNNELVVYNPNSGLEYQKVRAMGVETFKSIILANHHQDFAH